jgi:hypothetical protein
MLSKRFAVLLSLLLAAAPSCVARAQGTSGAQFLGVGVGARPMGMGGAFVSLADDGTALSWNPAGLVRATGHRVTVSHVSWLSNTSYEFASYAVPFGADAALGVALEQGSVSFGNTASGSFKAGDFSGCVGYARRFRSNLSAGAGLKIISSSLDEDGAASYAVDLGAVYELSDAVAFGAAARNLGPGLTFRDSSDPLPATLTLGGSVTWKDVLVALDIEKQNDLSAQTRVGLEYRPVRHLALRGGFISGDESALSAATGGLGFDWNDRWALDYAYRASDLGGTHQLGFSAGFGGESQEAGSGGGGGVTIAATDIPETNISVISELTREVMDEALDRMKIPAGSAVSARQDDKHDAGWLVESILLEKLTARGHTVMNGPAGPGERAERPAYQVTYRIVSCETTFPRAWREWVVGSRKVERRTRVDIYFQLSDSSEAIVWAGGVERERREIIPGSRAAELATPGQAFTAPEVEAGGWDKILEPLVVAGIVGGLIYLFYTSRSTN